MSGVQPVPETAEVREAYMLHGRGLDFRGIAVAQGDAFDAWLSARDSEVATRNYALGQQDPVRALPDRDTLARTMWETDRTGVHEAMPWDALGDYLQEPYLAMADAVLALFGQEGQR